MSNRIEKKQEEIKKIEKRIQKWESRMNEEGFKKMYDWLITIDNYEEIKERSFASFIEECQNEIRIATKAKENAIEQLEKIKRQEMKFESKQQKLESMPAVLIEFMNELVDEWNRFDKEMKVFYKKQQKEMSHHDFVIKYGKQAINLIYSTDAEIEETNRKHGEQLVINLHDRVCEKVGKIEDVSGLFITSGNQSIVINGTVKGTSGTCKVESIGAGGYNIQKYHIRTIVK